MDAKHTPGPWAVESCYDGGRTICEMRSAERLVCVNATEDADPRGYYATDANARLIAAAPELLAALKELAALMPVYGNDHDISVRVFQVPTGSVRKALAAIAEAEGGQQ